MASKSGKGMTRERYEHIRDNIRNLELDLENGIILNRKPKHLSEGYLAVNLAGKNVRQHQIFAVARWGEQCVGMTVDHIDGCRTNNRSDNLRLLTHGNNNKVMRNRSGGNGPKQPIRATNLDTGEEIVFESQSEAAKQLNIDRRSVNGVVIGRRKTTGGYKFERVAD